MARPRRALFLKGALSAAVFVLVALVATTALWRSDASNRAHGKQLARNGTSVIGTITGRDPQGHDVVSYTFATPDGRLHAGKGTAFDTSSPADRASGPIRVMYDANDPAVSCLCSPSDLLAGTSWASDLVLGGLMAVLPAAAMLLVLLRRGRED